MSALEQQKWTPPLTNAEITVLRFQIHKMFPQKSFYSLLFHKVVCKHYSVPPCVMSPTRWCACLQVRLATA